MVTLYFVIWSLRKCDCGILPLTTVSPGRACTELESRTRAVTLCPAVTVSQIVGLLSLKRVHSPRCNASSITSFPVRPLPPIIRSLIFDEIYPGSVAGEV
jgi:hypothetical protein